MLMPSRLSPLCTTFGKPCSPCMHERRSGSRSHAYIGQLELPKASHAADGVRDADSRYLLAQCCMQLGKLPEAEQALLANTENDGVCACPSGTPCTGPCRASVCCTCSVTSSAASL